MFSKFVLRLALSALLTIGGNGYISYLGDPGNWNGFIGDNAPAEVSAISVDYYESDSDMQTTANVLAHFRTTTLLGNYDSGSDETTYSGYIKYKFETQNTVSHISFDTLNNPNLYIQFGSNLGPEAGNFTFYVFFHGLKNIDFEVLANRRNLQCDITVDSGSIVTGTGGYSNLYDLVEAFKNQNHLDLQSIYNLLNNTHYSVPLESLPAYYMFRYSNSYYTNSNENFIRVTQNSQYPILTVPSTTFSYTGFHVDTEDEIYFLFLTNSIYSDIKFRVINTTDNISLKQTVGYNGQLYLCKFLLDTKDLHQKWIYPYIPTSKEMFIPVYIGSLDRMPDDIATMFGIDKYQTTTSELDNTNDNLNSAAGEQESITSQFDSSFNNSIGNVPTSSDLSGNSNFLNSANWVKTQFDNLTNNNAFGSVLQFSLLIGFALALFARFF